MNFVFWLIVLVILGAVWVALCNIFPALGAKFFKIKDEVKSNIDEKEKQDENA